MLERSKYLLYYKRPEIQKAIVETATNREVAISYGLNSFGKRPDILQHPKDVIEFVKQGASSFHVSEEIWSNPLLLNPNLTKKDMDEIRIGWDLVLDIDCHFLEYSKIAADLVIKALKYNGIESISCKFSGNHGFHIGVPFKAFPEEINNTPTNRLFPEACRKIAEYLKEMIKNPLSEKIMFLEKDFSEIIAKVNKDPDEIIRYQTNSYGDKIAVLNAEPFLNIDTILISSRHLYRMAYSFNEKSNLVSIPINPERVLEFNKESAEPEKIEISEYKFLDDSKTKENEAKQLLVQAYDFCIKKESQDIESKKQDYEYEELTEAVPQNLFPPCIKKILEGMDDGKKRALFILVNFLTSLGWSYEEMKSLIEEWNQKNPNPLKQGYIQSQIRHHQQNKKKILPPNCDNQMYYKDLQICSPDSLCNKIKNPVNYSRIKIKFNKNPKTINQNNDDDKTQKQG